MAPQFFLQPGSGVAVEIERPRVTPAQRRRQTDSEGELPVQPAQADEVLSALHAWNVREAIAQGLAVGNAITRAIYQERQ